MAHVSQGVKSLRGLPQGPLLGLGLPGLSALVLDHEGSDPLTPFSKGS